MGRSGDDGDSRRRPGRPRRRLAGAGLSLAAHAGLLAALLWAAPQLPKISPPPPPAPAVAYLDAPPAPEPAPAPAPAPSPSPAPAPPAPSPSPAPAKAAAPAPAPKSQARTPPRPARTARPAAVQAEPAPDDDGGGDPNGVAPELTGADLAGAVSAGAGGGGGGGGPCDMARRVQAALRKDRLVQAAVASARLAPGPGAHALLVWNGDWVQSGGEEGKGLSAVREAIMWEIGFAPAACRAEPVRGFILFTLNEAPGEPRLALGAQAWRWSDLLGPRPAP